jgi:hypothetical protein
MTNAADVPPEDKSNEEVESPVDGPTPDWMRLATSASSGPSLTEENMPAWLKSIKAGKGLTKDEPQPAQSQPDSEPSADEASSSDTISDLERLLAEEGIDLSSVSEERPEGSENMSARDWLISTSSDEIIRNKLETKPVEEAPPEETPVPTPVTAQAPSSPPAPIESDSEAASELERFLAEEGIDLSSVQEERPEGSENMSARDWLIATSSDEIIRNKLETEPVAEAPAPAPQPSTSDSDDKIVVAEDLPDWLRDIGDETVEAKPSPSFESPMAAAEDDQFLAKSELPDWLQEIAEESTTPVVADMAEPASDSSLFSDDKIGTEEGLPDWLREIADEAPQATAAEPTPSGPTEPPSTPVTKRPGTGPLSSDKMVVEEDLPDWLREDEEVAAEVPTPTEVAAVSPGSSLLDENDKMIVQEDLPDWLQEIAVESPTQAESEESVWTDVAASPLSRPPDEDIGVVEEDLPDWLREASTETLSVSEELTAPATTDADRMVVAEDMPDWLREVEDRGAIPVVEEMGLPPAFPSLDSADSDEDLPEWLREVEASSAGEDLPTLAFEPGLEATVPSAEGLHGLDEEEEEDLPDWLREVQEREGEPEPSTAIAEPVLAPLESPISELVAEEELPDWLKEVQEETEPLAFDELEAEAELEQVEAIGIGEEELPDWLQEVQEGIDEPFEPSEPTPEPFAEVAVVEELVVEEELPDWLQEAPSEMPVTAGVEAPTLAAVESAVVSEEVIVEEEGLPEWLREGVAEGEEVGEEVAVVEEVAAEEIAEVTEVSPPTPVVEIATVVTPAEIPDWLQKLREAQPEEQPIPVPAKPSLVPAMAGVARAAPEHVLAHTAPPPEPELPPDAEERFGLARKARDKGDLEAAIRIYDSLISSGAFLDKIIEDMQQSIKTSPTNYLLYQVMGDAMMRDGRLQSALNAYREALMRLQ